MIKYKDGIKELEFNCVADMLWYVEKSTHHEIKVEDILIGKSHQEEEWKSRRNLYKVTKNGKMEILDKIGECDLGERG